MPRKKTSRNQHSGRPSKFDLRRAKRIVKSIENGLTFKQAAYSAGISYNCFRMWRMKGKEDHAKGVQSEYRFFYVSTKEAVYRGIDRRCARIDKAAKRNWQADAWWLERVIGGQFAKREEVSHNGRVDSVHAHLHFGNGSQLPTQEQLLEENKRLIAEIEGERGKIEESNGHKSNGATEK